ncbi:MAG: acetate/propionate family kinase [Nitrospirae bacterium]|nr:acetate/propionate family kinase [Nitrospirota bacterium]
MTILTVNAGSSSIRLAVFVKNGNGISKLADRKYTIEGEPSSVLELFIQEHNVKDIHIIAHRIVHGGTRFTGSCFINNAVESEIDKLSSLAPLHNPHALKWIRTCSKMFGDAVPQAAVFDTSFYADLPEVAAFYALPKDLCRQYGIRRYGFHGIAHIAMLKRWKKLKPDLKDGGNVISLQLGAGCSVTAVRHGRAVDTSMGFSTLEGLVMATRSGDIDPEIIFHLEHSAGISLAEIQKMLNHSSGLLGISGISSDMRVLLQDSCPDARFAVELFCCRARKYIGAYMSVLGGADAFLFGGGIGENSPHVREKILNGMEWMGVILDMSSNSATIGEEACISAENSNTAVWVIPVDEASVIAEEAVSVLEKKQLFYGGCNAKYSF